MYETRVFGVKLKGATSALNNELVVIPVAAVLRLILFEYIV